MPHGKNTTQTLARQRGVIIVRTEDVERVTSFLERHSAIYHVRIVELTDEDSIALDMPTE